MYAYSLSQVDDKIKTTLIYEAAVGAKSDNRGKQLALEFAN